MTAQIWIAVVVGIAAVIDDLSRRRIANWIPAATFCSGLIWNTSTKGWHGTASSLLGALSGAAIFLMFYLIGGMGDGDVKLMAGFGALLGTRSLLEAALWTAGCGGLIAVAVIMFQLVRSRTPDIVEIPYAPAIVAGVWLALIPKS